LRGKLKKNAQLGRRKEKRTSLLSWKGVDEEKEKNHYCTTSKKMGEKRVSTRNRHAKKRAPLTWAYSYSSALPASKWPVRKREVLTRKISKQKKRRKKKENRIIRKKGKWADHRDKLEGDITRDQSENTGRNIGQKRRKQEKNKKKLTKSKGKKETPPKGITRAFSTKKKGDADLQALSKTVNKRSQGRKLNN